MRWPRPSSNQVRTKKIPRVTPATPDFCLAWPGVTAWASWNPTYPIPNLDPGLDKVRLGGPGLVKVRLGGPCPDKVRLGGLGPDKVRLGGLGSDKDRFSGPSQGRVWQILKKYNISFTNCNNILLRYCHFSEALLKFQTLSIVYALSMQAFRLPTGPSFFFLPILTLHVGNRLMQTVQSYHQN